MAASSVPAPAPLLLSGDHAQAWKDFHRRFEVYLRATDLTKQSDDRKVALLLATGGPVLLDIYDNLQFPARSSPTDPDPKNVLATVLRLMDKYFAPKSNLILSRYQFQRYERPDDMPLDTFVNKLHTLSRDCDFGNGKDERVRDQLVFGCADEQLREKFINEFFKSDALPLDEAMKICISHEATRRQVSAFTYGSTEAVNRLDSTRRKSRFSSDKTRGNKELTSTSLPMTSKACLFCGNQHTFGKKFCPAYNKDCSRCGRRDHYAKMCASLQAYWKKRKQKKKKVNNVQSDPADNDVGNSDSAETSEDSADFVFQVKNGRLERQGKVVFCHFKVGKQTVKFQIDSGASVNLLPRRLVPNKTLTPTDTQLMTWNNSKITPLGKCRITIKNCANDDKFSVEFIVVEQDFTPLLSKHAAEQMRLMKIYYENIACVDDILSNYPEVFRDSIGTLPGVVHLTIDPTHAPVTITSCRVPISLQDRIIAELKRLEQAGVIAKVDEPTDWVNRMVIGTKKSGDLRICIDPQALNRALKRELYPLPLLDDILPRLSKARVFSRFDLKHGYWHCVLDEESSYLTTFQTPLGRFRWKRVPFGMAVSSEIFQKKLHTALEGLDGVFCVADDILVYGEGDSDDVANADHDRKVRMMLERCRDLGIVLNKSKTALRTSEISFLGHTISKDGVKPDPEKVKAIAHMQPPADVHDVMRLSGMVNYLSRFLPNLSDVMEPIRRLTRKDVAWQWHHEQQKAFSEIKKLVTSAPILTFYKQNDPLEIQCDASQKGLGAVLMQNGKPISYASRALTPTETRYAQIEKEMLAVVFALTKFHQYTYGRLTKIKSDHKPLQAIMKKPLDRAPRRLQGMLLRAYQYDIDLEYQPGISMHVADLLSRRFLPENEGGQDFETINMVSFLPVRPSSLEKIQKATADDEVMTLLTEMIMRGWPDTKADLPNQLIPYFASRDEYSVQNGLIFKGERVVIPCELRKEIKTKIHSSHIGVEGCLRRARECVYWPGMNAEIKEYVSQCETCNKYNTDQRKETLLSHETGDRPWDRIGVDLFEMKNQNFLVTVDYFSNFWEIDSLESTKASTVIRKLKAHFARYGIPSTVISDNGPQFISEGFQIFARNYDFRHQTSSPKYPQSNGMAESAVKMAKTLLRKAADSGQDPHLAILDHRNTPSQDMGLSPAQRSLGRRTRTLLPMSSRLLQPKGIDTSMEKKLHKLKNMKSAWYYNRSAKDLEPLDEGDVVRVRPSGLNDKVWKKGIVNKRLDGRSYEVLLGDSKLRRNRVHLRKSSENVLTDHSEEQLIRHDPRDECAKNGTSDVDPRQESTETNVDDDVYVREPVTSRYNLRPKPSCKMPSRFKDFVLSH